MSVSILEALQNAQHNVMNLRAPIGMVGGMAVAIQQIAEGQLKNAVALLEKGYSLDEHVEPLLEKHGCIEEVPDVK